MRYHERAPFVPIAGRPKLTWPNKARLAVWVVPNIEYWHEDSLHGATIATPAREVPDVPNYSWREYGARVGIWRMMRILRDLDIKGTVALNSDVCAHYPQVVEACAELGWEFMGHGLTNSASMNGLPEHEERAVIPDVLETIARKTGTRPIGWLGQGLAETEHTIDILAENGVQYVGDWVSDEQPHPLKTTHRSDAFFEIVAMPYTLEINDIGVFMRRGFSGPDYDRMIRDQFDVLYEEAAETGKVMCVALHPYITGVPFRAKYLESALTYMREKKRVWFATGSEILAAYKAQR
ncbi:MAG TPA: polysaccharide deacetylase family protein [Candidatus Binatia bacterium]|nr:polysaccharide deacetylase family protein [Candidatus Binatia bacterium]